MSEANSRGLIREQKMVYKKSSNRSEPIDPAFSQTCFLCNRPFQFGRGMYHGKNIPDWGIMICDTCKSGNWDGIVLEHHPKLRDWLVARGIEYSFNAKGWLDIPN